jgi:hypothetical protein
LNAAEANHASPISRLSNRVAQSQGRSPLRKISDPRGFQTSEAASFAIILFEQSSKDNAVSIKDTEFAKYAVRVLAGFAFAEDVVV